MDANRFDDLVKRVATTRLTRVSAIRGLAAGAAAAVTGLSLSSSEADAKKKKGKKRKKKSICDCSDSTVASCRPMKLKKKKAKKQLRSNRCSYSGLCKGFNPCSPIPTTIVTQTTPGFPIEPDSDDINITINVPCLTPGEQGSCLGDTTCVAITGLGLTLCLETCTTQADCTSGACVLGVCLPLSAGGGCDTSDDCETGSCVAGICAFCDVLKVCGTGTDAECCVVDADCDEDLNVCVLSTD